MPVVHLLSSLSARSRFWRHRGVTGSFQEVTRYEGGTRGTLAGQRARGRGGYAVMSLVVNRAQAAEPKTAA